MHNLFFGQRIIKFSAAFLWLMALAVLAGCSDSTSSVPGATGATGTPTLTITLSTNAINTGVTSQVTATLKDGSGAAMAGQVVTFGTDGSFGFLTSNGTLTPSTTALTDASGVAIVTLNQAINAATGAAYVTASAQGLSASAGYSTGGVVGSVVTVGSISVTASSTLAVACPAGSSANLCATADGYSLITIKATVLSPTSAPLANQTVNFSSALGSLSGSTAVTNASGVAQVFLTTPKTVGTASVIAYTGGIPATDLLTYLPGLPATVSISSSAASVSASGTSTITATLKDFNGNAVSSGQTVSFGTSSPSAAPSASSIGGYYTDLVGATVTSATTDLLGQARVIYVAGTCTGSCTDFLTANATNGGATVYATNLTTLAVGGAVGVTGTPTLTIGSFGTNQQITSGTPVSVTATVLDATGAAVPYTVVTFGLTDTTLATITPSNGTALTNASGQASISLTGGGNQGATTIKATAQVGTVAVTGSTGFSVGATAVTMTNPVFGANPLSAFGTTSMTVTISGTNSQTVNFTSTCGSSGKAVLSTGIATVAVAGVQTAVGSYRDNGCASTDTITASINGGLATSTGTLTVIVPTAGSIQYISSSPDNISLKGTGSNEVSQVTFKVLDTGGNPLSGKAVAFGLSTNVGGITLTPNTGVSPYDKGTATSDANGLVVTSVNAGTFATPVRVTATICAGAAVPPACTADTALATQSSQLSITTGIPTQSSTSLSATTLNIEGWDHDGVNTVLTARLADHFGNPVPDGTAVNFISEGARVDGSCVTTAGDCSVTFNSQQNRPTDGRITVLAYAVGEESFVDLNGNGVADKAGPANELKDINGASTDMPEAWVDYNENGAYDPATEPYIDFNSNGVHDFADGSYNGVLCSALSSAGTCSATKTIDVRRGIVIVLSGSHPNFTNASFDFSLVSPSTLYDATTNTLDLQGCGGPQTIQVGIVDVNGNLMPAGTTVVFKANSDGKIVSTSGNFPVENANTSIASIPAYNYSVTIQGDGSLSTSTAVCTDTTPAGALEVTVTTPLGNITSVVIANLKN